MAKSVEKVYGQALFEVAKDSDDIDYALLVFTKEEDLLSLLKNPQINPEEKNEILDSIFKGNVNDGVLETIKLLVKNGRQKQIVTTLKYVVSKIKEDKKIGVVYVTSDKELSKKDKDKIESKLLETTDYRELEINYSVDKSLLGGLVIRINDRVVDSSLKTKLMQISRELTKVSLDNKMFD